MSEKYHIIPFCVPTICQEEIDAVSKVLRSGWLVSGKQVQSFENQIRRYISGFKTVAVNSCTSGLRLAFETLPKRGKVLLPSFTFISTVETAVQAGFEPVFVEIGDDYNLDVEDAERKVDKDTVAIVPVHFGGQACDLEKVYAFAKAHGLYVVEDAAHAIGSTYKGMMIGSKELAGFCDPYLHAVVFSFYATKMITTGEGGVVSIFRDDEIFRQLRDNGITRRAYDRENSQNTWAYDVERFGFNFDMTDIAAAIGIEQLKKIEGFISSRERIADLYDLVFRDNDLIRIPVRHADRRHTFYLYTIRVNFGALRIDKERFIEELAKRGVIASVHFIPVHMFKVFRQNRLSLPKTEEIGRDVISLPIYPTLSLEDAEYVSSMVGYTAERFRR